MRIVQRQSTSRTAKARGPQSQTLRLGGRFGICSSREWKLVKVVCFSKRITEIISSLYLFISTEGRTPLSPEPRSVARAEPSPDPPGGVPAQPRPRSPHRAHLGPRTDTPGPPPPPSRRQGDKPPRGQPDEPPQGLRDESQVTPGTRGRGTRGAGGRSAPQPRAAPDRPRSRG